MATINVLEHNEQIIGTVLEQLKYWNKAIEEVDALELDDETKQMYVQDMLELGESLKQLNILDVGLIAVYNRQMGGYGWKRVTLIDE